MAAAKCIKGADGEVDCLHCNLPKCLYDYEEELNKRKPPGTNVGVKYASVNSMPGQLFPTKHGYEYFVFRPFKGGF